MLWGVGPSHSIPNLLYWLRQLGVDVSLLALQPPPAVQLEFPQSYYGVFRPLGILGVSPPMRRELDRCAAEAHVLHTHCMWRLPGYYAYGAARRNKCQLVISPRGMATQWALRYKRWRKRLIWETFQKQVLFGADCLHATGESEMLDLRALGATAPIAVIPNGVDLPDLRQCASGSALRTLLFLGRVHPKKGIHKLLCAWRILCNKHPGWRLEIVGPGQ